MTLQDTVEYQIFIGCHDAGESGEVVNHKYLEEMAAQFFARKRIGFSIMSVQGGYQYENGDFVTEDSLCINLVGEPGLDIVKLARSLAMYMNQERVLIVRNALQTEYR